MKIIFLLLTVMCCLGTESFYNQPLHSADGSQLDLNRFSGKKILIVNIATAGDRVPQLGELQQLHMQMGDSLVIIAVPSNSFGNTNGTAAEVAEYCRQQYSASYLISAGAEVKGNNQHPLYAWLTQAAKNGALDSEVKTDFQKYLIDKNGELMGAYAGSVSVFSPAFIHALNQ